MQNKMENMFSKVKRIQQIFIIFFFLNQFLGKTAFCYILRMKNTRSHPNNLPSSF